MCFNSKWCLFYRNQWNTHGICENNIIPSTDFQPLSVLLRDVFRYNDDEIKQAIRTYIHDFVKKYNNNMLVLIGRTIYQKQKNISDIQQMNEVQEFYYTLFDIIENTVGYNYLIIDECDIKSLLDSADGTLYNKLINGCKEYRSNKIQL